MSAEVVVLATRRPFKQPRELTKIEAGPRVVYLTVLDGAGDPIELAFDAHQAAEFRDQFEAAMSVAEDLGRV